jgi:hypothetical protein
MQDATQDEDCTITGMETQHGPACNIDGELLFDDALLAATQASRHSHQTGAYTDKEDLMLGRCLVAHWHRSHFWSRAKGRLLLAADLPILP